MADEQLHSRYRLYLCPQCGEQHQFAGFCDHCNVRLAAYSCVPVEKILQERDKTIEMCSHAQASFLHHFIDSLLRLP